MAWIGIHNPAKLTGKPGLLHARVAFSVNYFLAAHLMRTFWRRAVAGPADSAPAIQFLLLRRLRASFARRAPVVAIVHASLRTDVVPLPTTSR